MGTRTIKPKNNNDGQIGSDSKYWDKGYFNTLHVNTLYTSADTIEAHTIKLTSGALVFEGSDADNYELVIGVNNPTSDKIILFPDAAGTVALTSDIPTPPDEVVSTGTHILKQTKVTLSQANCNDLNSSPQTLVAAQGANTIIMPVEVVLLVDRNSADTSGADMIVGYNGTTSFLYAIRYLRRFMYGITTDMTYIPGGYAGKGANSLTGGVNVPLTISTSTGISNNSLTSMVVYTSYYVIDNS